MKASQAAEILGIEAGSELTLDILKMAYRRSCSKYHPDKGGSTEMMQAVNAAYDALQSFTGTLPTEGTQAGYGEALNAALAAIVTLPGLSIEVCGLWVWVSGDTRTHKDAIKAAGYYWASKKHMWYFRPADASGGRGTSSIDEIREKYGSSKVSPKHAPVLN